MMAVPAHDEVRCWRICAPSAPVCLKLKRGSSWQTRMGRRFGYNRTGGVSRSPEFSVKLLVAILASLSDQTASQVEFPWQPRAAVEDYMKKLDAHPTEPSLRVDS